jgi:hypothetical protein
VGEDRGSTGDPPAERSVADEAADAYSAYLIEAYGLTREEVSVPDAYRGEEADWYGHLNEVLHLLDGYGGSEVAAILRRPDARLGEGETLLSNLRAGNFRRVHRLARRM